MERIKIPTRIDDVSSNQQLFHLALKIIGGNSENLGKRIIAEATGASKSAIKDFMKNPNKRSTSIRFIEEHSDDRNIEHYYHYTRISVDQSYNILRYIIEELAKRDDPEWKECSETYFKCNAHLDNRYFEALAHGIAAALEHRHTDPSFNDFNHQITNANEVAHQMIENFNNLN